MRRLTWRDLTAEQRRSALARPPARRNPTLEAAVRAIVADVAERGWPALAEHAQRLDGAAPRVVATAGLAAAARASLAADQITALALAARDIGAYHEATLPTETKVESIPGLAVRRVWRPIERVGLYIPGGATPLFSTLLMMAIPARCAGVHELVVVTPPRPDGSLDPLLALAADLCDIERMWLVGGAQAIAALAFGVGDIPRVDKICGPGNAWVSRAKTEVAAWPGGPAIDLPAGPSELMVIAEASADPDLIAADLLSQAEHDAAAQVLLLTPSAALAEAVVNRLAATIVSLPRRTLAETSLANGVIILVESLDEAVAIANAYAPEHLSLTVDDWAPLAERVQAAGAVFAGAAAAETFGDYLAGPSHVLPTDGAARAWSGLGVQTFLKSFTIQSVTPPAAARLAGAAAALARLEGLEAHARAAEARLMAGGAA